jgi:hypothetical protein
LGVRARIVHQIFLAFDEAAAQQHVGVELAMLDLVPDLARTHALKVDILRLLVDRHRENLRRHLLERHEGPFGSVTGAGADGFVLVAAGLEIGFGELQCLRDELVPERQAAFGLAQAKVDARSAEAGGVDPFF